MKPAALPRCLDRASLAVMVAGVALVLQPWWPAGFRLGFAITGAGVLLEILAVHLPGGPALEDPRATPAAEDGPTAPPRTEEAP